MNCNLFSNCDSFFQIDLLLWSFTKWKHKKIPYLSQCYPGVLFFNMGFWVGVNSKSPPKSGLFQQKVGVYSRKPPKTRLFHITWGSIQEWGSIDADTVGNSKSIIKKIKELVSTYTLLPAALWPFFEIALDFVFIFSDHMKIFCKKPKHSLGRWIYIYLLLVKNKNKIKFWAPKDR